MPFIDKINFDYLLDIMSDKILFVETLTFLSHLGNFICSVLFLPVDRHFQLRIILTASVWPTHLHIETLMMALWDWRGLQVSTQPEVSVLNTG